MRISASSGSFWFQARALDRHRSDGLWQALPHILEVAAAFRVALLPVNSNHLYTNPFCGTPLRLQTLCCWAGPAEIRNATDMVKRIQKAKQA